ncbi:membrane dipeptidase-domain-containing protein [Chytridium lagenaria]|nr:membrane dipeptidase-domain-containing protein [Chytridium lagenaria]
MNRRHAHAKDVVMLAVATVILLAFMFVCCEDVFMGMSEKMRPNSDPLERAYRLLRAAPIIDTHNDLPIKIQGRNHGFVGNLSLESLPFPEWHTDINRLFEGRVGAQFWSAYVPCRADYKELNTDVRFTLDQIDLIKNMVEKYHDVFSMAYSAQDIHRIRKSGKIASLIGVEGGHQIDSSLGALRQMYSLGVRYMTLTHVCHTSWADSCFGKPLHNGLAKEGEKFIYEMNRLGMLVDLSHVSDTTMHRVIEISKAPVFFSHSSARALCGTPRNVPDDVLFKLPQKDGVVMINFSPSFISCGPEGNITAPATLEQVADHISHIAKLIGAKHIGIGSDFDGIPDTPVGLEDVSKYPYLVAELFRRGFTDEEIVGIVGGNILRVFSKAERVAQQLQTRGGGKAEGGISVERTCPSKF